MFQCNVGCRIGDLIRLKKRDVINEIASSHMARRAFTRYRTIDIDMKKDLVKILEGKQ